jgi:peptide/nickel transport system substrate-binding protein
LTEPLDRREFLKRSGFAAAMLGVLGAPELVAALAGSGEAQAAVLPKAVEQANPSKSIASITLPFLADMGEADPDNYYAGEGLQVTLSVYESLVTYTPRPAGVPLVYQPVDKRISPGLAESWEISADGLTYTFHLRPNVKFHDGTPMDAVSWQKGFVRRAKVNQGPAYQVAPVAHTAAPDPLTFVVTLKHPVNPFLDYMACPWSPKAISPTAVAAHTVGGDEAQKWISTHDAGTGPYMITEWVPNDHYTLQAFGDYWGPAPQVKTVHIPIIPDIQTQELELKAGQIDIMTKGMPIQDVETFAKESGYTVKYFPLALMQSMFINTTKGRIFADDAVRQALGSAINRTLLTSSVFKNTDTVATQFFPGGCFPNGLVSDNPAYDPSKLTDAIKDIPSKTVDIAYGSDGGAPNQLLAELAQAELQAAGLDVTVRSIATSLQYSLYDTPDKQRPDILLDSYGGDTIHVDTMLRVIFRTGAEPLNWFNVSYPEGDRLMDKAAEDTNAEQAIKDYTAAALVYRDAGVILSFCNASDIIVTRAGITNIVHDPMAVQTIRLADLKQG